MERKKREKKYVGMVTFGVDACTMDILTKLAEKYACTRSVIVRQMVLLGIEKRKDEIANLTLKS